jgi:pimeloyl-ACP methyl ester carboxylesterase
MTAFLCRTCSITSLILVASIGAASGQSGTVVNEHFVQSSAEPDAKLYVRERLPADTDPAQLEEAVLFVHGSTYPGDTFDLEIEGYDWMTQVADSGMATYYVDIRGYGRSTRTPVMSDPPEKNEPFSRAVDAAKDVGDALDFVLERTGADEVNLIGWSWGTVITGLSTSENGDKVDKLVLYAPLYDEKKPAWVESMADPENPDRIKAPGAYRTHSAEQARARWESQIGPEDKSEWREEEVFQTWFQALLATEPEGCRGSARTQRREGRPLRDRQREPDLRRERDRCADPDHSGGGRHDLDPW